MTPDPLDVTLPDGLGAGIAGLAVNLHAPATTGEHSHRRGELLYAMSGRLSVETETGRWIIPSSYAMWIPGGICHTAYAHSSVRAACIFVEDEGRVGLPSSCALVQVEALLREVIFRLLGADIGEITPARAERLAAVMSDELAAAPRIDVELPWPQDSRMQRLVDLMVEQPSRRISLAAWASVMGLSERTLTRLFLRGTGMNPGRWRQRLHVRLAMQQLAQRRPVGNVAYDLGYDSPSAFIAMFKEVTGVTPGRFTARD